MISCPNCGGNLKFDISAQSLACEHCHSQFDPYAFDSKTSDAEQEKTYESNYEVTIFTCPQCGGEILSTDNAAAGFCSFCGASTILYSRISHEKRPNYIIPFKKTKQDCKKAYASAMKRAIFAPKELRDPKYIDSFRGIYMPYWAFYLTQNGDFELPGEKKQRRGDYVITDHYRLTGHLDAYYKGLSYDASSSFADSISEQLAPYDVKGMKAFTPAFLSGFYADTADVASRVYRRDAEAKIHERTSKVINNVPAFRAYQTGSSLKTYKSDAFKTKVEAIDSAMFPVWFMSYRKNDRVAYATVNGQTGKVVADIPVDPKKYVIGSLLLAIPIFIVLAMSMTLTPMVLMAVAAGFSIASAILYASELSRIVRQDSGIDDRGQLYRQKLAQRAAEREKKKMQQGSIAETVPTDANSETISDELNDPATLNDPLPEETMQDAAPVNTDAQHDTLVFTMSIVLWIEFVIAVILSVLSFFNIYHTMHSPIGWCVITVAMAVSLMVASDKVDRSADKKSARGFVWIGLAVILCTAIALIQPVSDLFYYGGVILTLTAVGLSFIDIIKHHNILSTRRLPQFDKQGGDDRA